MHTEIKKENLVEGIVYACERGHEKRIILFSKTEDTRGYLRFERNNDSHFHLQSNQGIFKLSNTKFFIATEEEKEHLRQCRKAKKYIPFKNRIPAKDKLGNLMCFKNNTPGLEEYIYFGILKEKIGTNYRVFNYYCSFSDHINSETTFHENSYNCDLATEEEKQTFLDKGYTIKDKIIIKKEEVKKWSVGTYVVWIKFLKGMEYYPFKPKHGTPYNIEDFLPNNTIKIKGEPINTKFSHNLENLKWFATKKEAEAFCKTLTEDKEITEYAGLKVGDSLNTENLSLWENNGNNRYQSDENKEWYKPLFSNKKHNRSILAFKEINGVIGFLVSDTANVYIRANGFKDFCEKGRQVQNKEISPESTFLDLKENPIDINLVSGEIYIYNTKLSRTIWIGERRKNKEYLSYTINSICVTGTKSLHKEPGHICKDEDILTISVATKEQKAWYQTFIDKGRHNTDEFPFRSNPENEAIKSWCQAQEESVAKSMYKHAGINKKMGEYFEKELPMKSGSIQFFGTEGAKEAYPLEEKIYEPIPSFEKNEVFIDEKRKTDEPIY